MRILGFGVAMCVCGAITMACSSSTSGTSSGGSSGASGTSGSAQSSSGASGASGTDVSQTPEEGGFCTTTGATRVSKCGWDVSGGTDDCVRCLDAKCCAESMGCTKDCACTDCTAEVAKGNATCITGNAEFKAALDCKQANCEVICARGWGGDTSCTANNCATSCPAYPHCL